ncbi:MAG: hypothetical protein COV75_02015 [Candidatus Omnitrophica bacterium CG11_big_fil_rev_8_21_14_0_20_63_9]|nr:MAG: hypothetical protein COV75_02015 [Candidatus Omnitrophica bacterium CG11_big_fil_rev_8_21_14_0_20_63_9]
MSRRWFFLFMFALALLSFSPDPVAAIVVNQMPAASTEATIESEAVEAGFIEVAAVDDGSMSDEELAEVSAGDIDVDLGALDVILQDNLASHFGLNISSNAFQSAQGLFTTIQAVNSAVNLKLIVNIFLGQFSDFSL